MNEQARIEFIRNEMNLSQMYAMYWHGMAVTGAATKRDTAQGREPTEEEKAKGQTIGWRPHTDDEKKADALATMMRHIDRYRALKEQLEELTHD